MPEPPAAEPAEASDAPTARRAEGADGRGAEPPDAAREARANARLALLPREERRSELESVRKRSRPSAT